MGLDVYLYWEKSRAEIEAYEQNIEHVSKEAFEKATGGVDYNVLTLDEKKIGWAAEKRALDKAFLSDGVPNELQRDCTTLSKIDPKHSFKLGYFRSSYNDSGINNVLLKSIGVTLYDIFEVGVDDYIFTPDWSKARDNVVSAIDKYGKFLHQSMGFTTVKIDTMIDTISTESEALKEFLRQLDIRNSKSDDEKEYHYTNYSTNNGTFLMNGLSVHGVFFVPNKYERNKNDVILIVKSKNFVVENDWYYVALQIVLETIDYVLAQPDPEHYVLHWSG